MQNQSLYCPGYDPPPPTPTPSSSSASFNMKPSRKIANLLSLSNCSLMTTKWVRQLRMPLLCHSASRTADLLLASHCGLGSKWLFEGGGGFAAIWQETAAELDKQWRFAKTTQQECVVRQQQSKGETAVQAGRGVMQGGPECEDQWEGCHS